MSALHGIPNDPDVALRRISVAICDLEKKDMSKILHHRDVVKMSSLTACAGQGELAQDEVRTTMERLQLSVNAVRESAQSL